MAKKCIKALLGIKRRYASHANHNLNSPHIVLYSLICWFVINGNSCYTTGFNFLKCIGV